MPRLLGLLLRFPAMEETGLIRTMHFGAATMASSRIVTDMFQSNIKVHQTATGSHVLEGVRIFKSGTFRDSMGIERTWTPYHLQLMVAHYDLLKNADIFPNVPIRVDHSFSAKDVGGYFDKVYLDPADPENFLVADLEITETDVFEKWQRGTFRSRSLEVGTYETNDGAVYSPVIMGLAFVDIPAVEGLHGRAVSGSTFSQALSDKEPPMDEATFIAACTYASWLDAANYAQALQDWERAVLYAAALDAEAAANHARQGQPFTFRVNGQPTTDPAAVQRQIDVLEAYQSETIQGTRAAYVTSLATDSKITAAMVPSFTAMVTDMSDAAFAAFKAGYDTAPAASLFGNHGSQDGGGSAPANGAGHQGDPSAHGAPEASTLDTAKDILAQHKRTGQSNDFIKNTKSYKTVFAADPAAAESYLQ